MLPLTESMYYVLMALYKKDTFGTEITAYISRITNNRIMMGPGTLYTIISKFETDDLIEEVAVEGRKRTYAITKKGRRIFKLELARLQELVTTGMQIIEGEENG